VADQTRETGETVDETGPAVDQTGRARRAAVVLGALTILLGGFGAWATVQANSLRSSAAPQNVALTDRAATSAVNRQITSAVNTVFSYNYADTAATRRAAQSLLTGPAIHQYDTYFALVARDAPAQKLVVTTRVTNSGVELLTGNRARVLVFANQQDTREGTGQTSYAGALFAVTAVRADGRWKIENIDTFGGQ
jgi:Mce-associated membrane protein